MAITRLALVRELDQPATEVLLTYVDGSQTLLVSISRMDLTDFVKQPLLPSDQNFLVEQNLETLAAVIEGKRARGDTTMRTDPRTGRTSGLIELRREDLEQGLSRYPVIVESQETMLRERQELLGLPLDLMEKAMGHLNDRERHILTERWLKKNPTTLDDLSRQYGISPGWVRKIDVRAFEKLQKAIKAAAIERRLVTEAGAWETVFAPAEQRPAAYRFTLRDKKLDVLPEQPEPEDRQFALDTYEELISKARDLYERLSRTNSANRACSGIERLIAALGTSFDDLRPGVLLSRARSIEADRAAFDTVEARGELFADVFAMMDDTLQSVRDLLAVFPIVRRIEAERLALDLDRNAGAVPILRDRMAEIQSAAERSDAATDRSIDALAQNDAAIEEATDPVLRTSLVADKLLVVRNFLSAAASTLTKELSDLGGQSWAELKAGLPKGVGFAARAAPYMGLVAFTGWLAGPVASIAAVVPGFRGIASAFKLFAFTAEGADAKPPAANLSRERSRKPARKPNRKLERKPHS